MEILKSILLVVHLLSWAMVLGLSVGYLNKREVPKGVMHSAASALVTGLLIVVVMEMTPDVTVNHMKVGIKLLIAVAVTVLSVMAERKQDGHRWLGPIAGLTVVNVLLAVLW